MVLLIDNYDSFTYNLAQYFGELGCDVLVKRNDEISIDEIASLGPQHICISPGPCTPREAGISKEVVLTFVRAGRLIHGKSCMITHDGGALFSDLPNPFEGGRYHSLVVERSSFPACLEITAESDDGEIMALRHREFPVHGVQFHPESVLTRDGRKILARFLAVAPKTWVRQHKLVHV